MDLNELFSRHQIALIRAASAVEPHEHDRFAALAHRYAHRIGALQQSLRWRTAPQCEGAAL